MAYCNFAALARSLKKISRLLPALLLIIPIFSAAQISDARFRHISNEQGLSNSTINCIFQDSCGFMWFGTRDGLNRFDGVSVVVYKTKPGDALSISDNFIRCIYEDAGHSLWIGTSYGLNRFDPVTGVFTRYTHKSADGNSISADVISSVSAISDGNLLVGTVGGGLNIINIKTNKIKQLKYNGKANNSLSNDTINCIYRDKQKNLWIGTQTGLNRLDTAAFTFKHYGDSKSQVMAITEDNKQNLWLGTAGAGITVVNPATGILKTVRHNEKDANSLSGDLILSLLTDDKGNILVGTTNNGFNLYLPMIRGIYW